MGGIHEKDKSKTWEGPVGGWFFRRARVLPDRNFYRDTDGRTVWYILDGYGRCHYSDERNSEGSSSQAEDCSQTAECKTSVSELKDSIELRLKAARELYEAGMITEEEYEDKRREILREL